MLITVRTVHNSSLPRTATGSGWPALSPHANHNCRGSCLLD